MHLLNIMLTTANCETMSRMMCIVLTKYFSITLKTGLHQCKDEIRQHFVANHLKYTTEWYV